MLVVPHDTTLAADTVTVVILNWNGWRNTVACVAALLLQDYPALEIVVVDNGSTDGSESYVRAAFPQITVLQSGSNRGYAGGNNVGLRYALERESAYICLLNNDVSVPSTTVGSLVKVLETSPRLAAVGPTMYFEDGIHTWFAGSAIDRRSGKTQHRHSVPTLSPQQAYLPVPFLPGACFLVRADVVRTVGFLPEDYFLYYEDVDWSLAIRRAGWELGWVPSLSIIHLSEQSTRHHGATIPYYYTRNFYLFLRRNPEVAHSIPVARRMHVVSSAYRVARALLRGNVVAPSAVAKGIADGRTGVVGQGITHYRLSPGSRILSRRRRR